MNIYHYRRVFNLTLSKRNIKLPKTAGKAIFITQRIIEADKLLQYCYSLPIEEEQQLLLFLNSP